MGLLQAVLPEKKAVSCKVLWKTCYGLVLKAIVLVNHKAWLDPVLNYTRQGTDESLTINSRTKNPAPIVSLSYRLKCKA